MKIIYLTTAQDEKDYRSFMKVWKIPLNSSNQNFHEKFIRSLAINNQVDVISVRPFSRSKTKVGKLKSETKSMGNLTWHYVVRKGGRISRALFTKGQVESVLKALDYKNSVVITDTINKTIVKSIASLKKKYNLKVLGVCTDSPSNISGTKRSYTMFLLENCKDFDGYIALTSGLNDLFNPSGKPSYIFEGIVEDRSFKPSEEKKNDYFFFGGALMEKYGVYKLIEAYKELNPKYVDLYICGHHGDKEKIKDASKGYSGIKFLGLLPMNKVMEYESQSLACINPRPYSQDLDRFSIPSKTLEYMSMGRPVISVKNTILMERFPDEVIWIDSPNHKDLVPALEKVINMSKKERNDLGTKAKNRVLSLYSLESISKNIQPFLLKFTSKNIVD